MNARAFIHPWLLYFLSCDKLTEWTFWKRIKDPLYGWNQDPQGDLWKVPDGLWKDHRALNKEKELEQKEWEKKASKEEEEGCATFRSLEKKKVFFFFHLIL